jgi:hypothetical protein
MLTIHISLAPRLTVSTAIPLLPPTYFHSVDRDSFTFLSCSSLRNWSGISCHWRHTLCSFGEWEGYQCQMRQSTRRSDFAFLTVIIRKARSIRKARHYSVAAGDTTELKTAPEECGTEDSGILNCDLILGTRQWTHCQTSRWRSRNSSRSWMRKLPKSTCALDTYVDIRWSLCASRLFWRIVA